MTDVTFWRVLTVPYGKALQGAGKWIPESIENSGMHHFSAVFLNYSGLFKARFPVSTFSPK